MTRLDEVKAPQTNGTGRVDVTPGGGIRIPKERYISASFVELEYGKLWPRVWQVACREEELAKVGDYVEYVIGDQSILLMRTDEAEIKGYYNACLHRGTQLKTGTGNVPEIRCRFHGWRWNIDGSLKDIPVAEEFDPECVREDCLRLPEVQIGRWGGFVFVNMDPDCEPLLDFLGPIPASVEPFEVEKMRFTYYRTIVVQSNWKTALDAFNEVYHVPTVHPQTLLYVDGDKWEYTPHGVHSVMSGSMGSPSPRLGFLPDTRTSLRAMIEDFEAGSLVGEEEMAALQMFLEGDFELADGQTLGAFFASIIRVTAAATGLDYSAFTDDELILSNDWNVFPNLMLAVSPGNGFAWRFRPNGNDPDSCLFDAWGLGRFPPAKEVPPLEREFYKSPEVIRGWGRTIRQDIAQLPHVQRGMHSRSFSHIICGRAEGNIVNFHRALMSYLSR